VTEIIGLYKAPELVSWFGRVGNKEAERVSNEAADLGTRVHALIEESFSRDEAADSEDELASDLAARVFEWAEEQHLVVVEKELGLLNLEDGYGGTPDAFVRFGTDEELLVCDWKTAGAIHETYALQLAAYARSYNLSKGLTWETGVSGGVIVRPDKRHPKKPPEVKYFDKLNRDFLAFEGLLRLFRFLNRRGEWSK
jgi:hypothetical protein